MRSKRPIIYLVAVLVIGGLAAGCYWASLVISLKRLEAAIRDGNVDRLESSVDWVAVRDHLRSEIRGSALRHFYEDVLSKREEPGYFVGALLAGTIAPAMVDQLVDSFATPQGFADLLAKRNRSSGTDITITPAGYTDFDEYTIEFGPAPADPAKALRAVLRRQGVVWRVVRVGFPPGKAPWDAAEPPWAGLKIEKLAPSRTPDGLVIEGDIANTGKTTQDLPRLRVALRDASDKEVQFKMVDPPQPRLAPGALAHFKTPFDHPEDAAKGVVVTFARSGQ